MRGDTRGFTFVELLVVSVLSVIVLTAGLQILIMNQRAYTAQNQVIMGQQSNRMSFDLLFNELREVSPAGGDILGMGPDTIRVRLMRKFGIVCEADLTAPRLRIENLPGRAFEAGDSVFIYADGDEGTATDDVWIETAVTGVDTSVACPQDGASATDLTLASGAVAAFAADSVGLGAPVRSYDKFSFLTTTLLGDTYLGRREPDNSVTPIAGPIRATSGLEFEYRDASGTVTTSEEDVRQIVVTVRTGEGVLNANDQAVSDSITAWIYTRS